MPNFRSLVGGFYSSNPDDKSVPVTIRMNNPGAINGAMWQHSYPGYVDEKETTPGNHSTIVETPEEGVAMWWELMRKYRAAGVTTVGGIIRRYGGGQDYSNYVRQVVAWTGFTETSEIPLSGDDERLLRFAVAMFRYEAGKEIPWSDKQILYGFRLGRKIAETNPAAPPPAPERKLSPFESFFRWLSRVFSKQPSEAPPWYLEAKKWIGFHEVGNNQGIGNLIQLAHCGSEGDPWCAIFVNAMLEKSGARGSRSALARSFEHSEDFIRLPGPALGAITTMWRGSSASGQGHVFFYDGEVGDNIRGIAGNEDDEVVQAFHSRSRVVGYYWPAKLRTPRIGSIVLDRSGNVAKSEV